MEPSAAQPVFLEELKEGPAALRRLIGYYESGEGFQRLVEWRRLAKANGAGTEWVMAGMGSSHIAAASWPLLVPGLGGRVLIREAGEWLDRAAEVCPARLTVLISQSGESVEIVRLIEEGLARPPIVAVTNDETSLLGRRADLVLPILAGRENSISTKTYANSLALLLLLATALNGSQVDVGPVAMQLAGQADRWEGMELEPIQQAARALDNADGVAFIGRGPALISARQAALTFMEGGRMLCASFSGGAFRHGPFEYCDTAASLVFFASRGEAGAKTLKLAREAAGVGAHTVVMADSSLTGEVEGPVIAVENAGDDAWFPLAAAPVQARLLFECAQGRGLDCGGFRYGGKVTRIE